VILTDPDTIAVAAAASAVLGKEIDNAECVSLAGRNSRIYRIRSGDKTFALKKYPKLQNDTRDRLQAEVAALCLMERYGIQDVPRVVGASRQQGFLLLNWIEGTAVTAVTAKDVDAANEFLTSVHNLRRMPEARSIGPAAEACLSGDEIERQIRARLDRLDARRGLESALAAFLDHSFLPAFDRILSAAYCRTAAEGLQYAVSLPRDHQTLIPADFGFHNSLRRSDGTLAFIDFEYFGWDDPVKLTADFLLHPGMTLDSEHRMICRKAAEQRYNSDPHFSTRLNALLPLFGLRWVLVVLNEFLPERWEVRLKAGNGASDWTEAKARQLSRAQALLDRTSDELQESERMGTSSKGVAIQSTQPELDERSKYLRRLIVRGLAGGGRGHVGSAMSLVEIMRVLYDDILRYRPHDPRWSGRDRMILSKGHGCLALYAILADKGFIPIETLDSFCKRDSILGGHPEAAKIPGVEASTGALGHGLSYGLGMAIAARIENRDSRVFVVMGDGEINEGSVWEAAMCAGKHRVSNMTAIIDYNKLQSAGPTREIQDLEPLVDKWHAFGFAVQEVDGHDTQMLRVAFQRLPLDADQPTAIICHTVKGKGIPFAEHDAEWHHKAKITPDVVAKLYKALE
jgi:transketolase